MDPQVVSAIGTLLTATAALALSVEARVNNRAKVHIVFPESIVGILSSRDPNKFAAESIHTALLIFNSGRRPSVIEEVTCHIMSNGHRDDLLNASKIIYKTMSLPIPLPNDSAHEVEIAWILGRAGFWERYNGRFSSLPSSAEYELKIKLFNGKVFSQKYAHRNLYVMPLEQAQEYQAALKPQDEGQSEGSSS
jgi:hypothetical protein